MSILLRAVWLAVLLAVSLPAGLTSAWADDEGGGENQNENEDTADSEDASDDDSGGAGESSGGSGGDSGGAGESSGGSGGGSGGETEDDDHEYALKGVQAGRLFSLQVILKATRARLTAGERILDINLKRRRKNPQYEVTILGRTGTLRTMRFRALRPPKVNN